MQGRCYTLRVYDNLIEYGRENQRICVTEHFIWSIRIGWIGLLEIVRKHTYNIHANFCGLQCFGTIEGKFARIRVRLPLE